MNVALQPWTRERFLAWEERQERPWEFDGFQPIAMVGVTGAHGMIQANLMLALGNSLRRKPCRPLGNENAILAGNDSVRYPDAFVVCTPIDEKGRYITDPVVIFEILSDSTAMTDLVTKKAEYQATPSVQRYIVLDQTQVLATVFARQGDGWIDSPASGMAASLDMPEIGLTIAMADVYEGLSFAEHDT